MDLDSLESYFEELEVSLKQLNANDVLLSKEYYHYVEMKEVLEKNKAFLAAQERSSARDSDLADTVMTEGAPSNSGLAPEAGGAEVMEAAGGAGSEAVGYISGVIAESKLESFERVLFRSTRGNMLLRHASIDKPLIDPQTNAEVRKVVFIVFFTGAAVRTRIQKICEAMSANVYPCPRQKTLWDAKVAEVSGKLKELRTVVTATNDNKRQALRSAAGQIKVWSELLLREKSTYHTLNKFKYDPVRRCLMAEGWVPSDMTEAIQRELRLASEARGEQVPSILREKSTRQEPPTYFRTNAFTNAFQAIVDAYGIAKYQEINPAPFMMATFPFLFAVMFGDIGHGVILTIYASYLLKKAKVWGNGRKLPEMIRMTYNGRYLLFIMGLMSIYTGFLYNEIFSVPLYIWKSNFKWPEPVHKYPHGYTPDPAPCSPPGSVGFIGIMAEPQGRPYPFGCDPIWHGLPNELTFSNSLKMKLSVILGVGQMILGVVLSLLNHLFVNDMRSVWCEFVPQMLYLCGIFGYLCITIFIKWSINWNDCRRDLKTCNLLPSSTCRQAPSLTNMLITMFLAPGSVPEAEALYPGQAFIQSVLVLLAVVAVPWMLLAKPYLIKKEHARKSIAGSQTLLHSESTDSASDAAGAGAAHADAHVAINSGGGHGGGGGGGGGGGDHGHGDGEFDFSEIFVHQVIHTIEFVLGGVSHTASYLRLWALSLAHAQLSAVFWDKLMGITVNSKNPGMAVVGFACWFGATLGIILGMESLSAFLHAIRLHWVEFQSKFYKSDGRKFAPFSFNQIIADAESAEAD